MFVQKVQGTMERCVIRATKVGKNMQSQICTISSYPALIDGRSPSQSRSSVDVCAAEESGCTNPQEGTKSGSGILA
jgi:hypothetical protein